MSKTNSSKQDKNATPGNIDQIRDIIFGAQMQDYDGRFANLEKRLLKESSDLKKEMEKRMTQMETYLKKEFEKTSQALQNEQNYREEDIENLTQDLQSFQKEQKQKNSQIEDQTFKDFKEVRSRILQLGQTLKSEIDQKTQELENLLENETIDIRSTYTDRKVLASFLNDLSNKFGGETPPKKQKTTK